MKKINLLLFSLLVGNLTFTVSVSSAKEARLSGRDKEKVQAVIYQVEDEYCNRELELSPSYEISKVLKTENDGVVRIRYLRFEELIGWTKASFEVNLKELQIEVDPNSVSCDDGPSGRPDLSKSGK